MNGQHIGVDLEGALGRNDNHTDRAGRRGKLLHAFVYRGQHPLVVFATNSLAVGNMPWLVGGFDLQIRRNA
jgi:hypothetical protein